MSGHTPAGVNTFTAMKRKFGAPPPGYIPGKGRGATGFITRSDVGSAKAAGAGEEAPAPAPDAAALNDSNYDQFAGHQGLNLFKGSKFDQADDDADKVWQSVEAHLGNRRKRQREEREKAAAKEEEQQKGLKDHLRNVKADQSKLSTITEDQWLAIPDAIDHTIKKRKYDLATPMPDTMKIRAFKDSQSMSDAAAVAAAPPQGAEQVADIYAWGSGRQSVLKQKLSLMGDSVTGQTVVDATGYLSQIENKRAGAASVEDTKRAREIHRGLVRDNPRNGAAWIALARVEEGAGKLSAAREAIAQGCEHAPHTEEIWMEAVRLSLPQNAKSVVAKAVKHLPKSEKLWCKAAALETEDNKKRRVYQLALEHVPNSLRLWKEAIDVQPDRDGAKTLLRCAVECVDRAELWLTLAKLESYENARAVLTTATQRHRTDPAVWVAAAQLEESVGKTESMERIIRKAVKSLSPGHCTRESWIDVAKESEATGYTGCSQAVVFNAIGLDLEMDQREHVWTEDAERCLHSGHVKTARAIFAHALQCYPQRDALWAKAADVEKKHGTYEECEAILRESVQHCPKADDLWLRYAKEKWLHGEVDAARNILAEAFSHNPNSEHIWVAAAKLEAENGHSDKARAILERARTGAGTTSKSAKIWMKSAKLERQTGNRDQERKILAEAVKCCPTAERLWLMLLQWEEAMASRRTEASAEAVKAKRAVYRTLYDEAIRKNPDSVALWKMASHLEEAVCKDLVKARSILEKSRARLPRNDELWLATVRLEVRHGQKVKAAQDLSKALQECPASGCLWAQAVAMEPPESRRARAADAAKKCEKDGRVYCAIARTFWAERKLESARKSFQRAVKYDADLGDTWASWYKFEVQHGTEEQKAAVLHQCIQADPHHGEGWIAVTKDAANCTLGGCRLSTEQVLKEVSLKVDDYE
eukprot:TRINITY_DN7076_c2_g1_i1.p1 TRINITY_DN7076_c2_g1~~TRINITY_DN7076_c2_g1_i1.p1  ORF type:complete len:951 (+),score=426.77 TRINITY_DN7076_c2_g1_i1:62-2854(+)